MIALDTSVVVAMFGAWHEHHGVARDVLSLAPALPGHAALEAYSVLTRLPEPFRADPPVVAQFLHTTFPAARLVLDADRQAALPGRLAGMAISGGAVYDALVALTAQAAGAVLVTLDRRALAIYERCGAAVRLLV